MKKFLFGIAVIVFILVALVFYQRQRVGDGLSKILKGQTYSSYGIKIQIPPTEGGVRGFFQPYVDVPRVILDLSAWGLKLPLNFENAVIFQDLWGKGGVILEIRREVKKGSWVILNPSAELSLDQGIKILGAEKIAMKSPKKSKEVRFLAPQLQMGPLAGVFPTLLSLGVEGIEIEEGKGDKKEGATLGAINLGIESEEKGDKRHWKFFSAGQGGFIEDKKGRGELGGWKFSVDGTAKDVSLKDLKALVTEIRQVIDEFDGANKKILKDQEEQKTVVLKVFDKGADFLRRLQMEFIGQDLLWEGVKVVDSEGSEKVLVSPLHWKYQFTDGKKLKITGEGGVEHISVRWDGERPPLVMDGLSFTQSADFGEIDFIQLTDYLLGYYRSMALQWIGNKKSSENFLEIFFSSLATYPDKMEFEIKIDRLTYTTKNTQANHRDFKLGFFIASQETGYYAQDEFDFVFPKDAEKDIKGGKGNFRLSFKLPWESILSASRSFIKAPQEKISYLEPFTKGQTGVGLKFLLDLGPKYFVVDLNSELDLALAGVLQGLELPNQDASPIMWEEWGEEAVKSIVKNFHDKGFFSFDVKIDRLSKLQAALEKMKGGSSLALVVIAPYSKVDNKADTLSIDLKFKEGQILVNGQPNEALKKLADPFFDKILQ